MKHKKLHAQVLEILKNGSVDAYFQPIVDVNQQSIHGHEALARGPVESNFHTPTALFEATRELGLTEQTEHLCREVALSQYSRGNHPQKLFLNISPQCLQLKDSQFEFSLKQLETYGVDSSNVVIEITEGSGFDDYATVREVVKNFRYMGFSIALDDLGEGFSSLRMWSEISPDYVKIDKHFIRGIHQDPVKLEFVRAIQKISEESGTMAIAEGVECFEELTVIKDLKIKFAQGYLLGKPNLKFQSSLSEEVRGVLAQTTIRVMPDLINPYKHATVANLMTKQQAVSPYTTNDEIYHLFQVNHKIHSIPVVDKKIPIGLISRFDTIDRFARTFQKELHGKKSCTIFMDKNPLVVQKNMTINALSELILDADPQYLLNGFIVVDGDHYVGTGSGHALLREVTNMQINAARYANPLTMLPGNVPINAHIDRLLENGQPFTACYCDLDNFKPFNDVYGYRRGDDMIQFVGCLLSKAAQNEKDFVGHIGGDDFILLFQSDNWEALCQEILKSMEEAMPTFYDSKDAEIGGIEVEDRKGNKQFFAFSSLSIGAVRVIPEFFKSHHEVAGAMTNAKKLAKKTLGNCLYIERRSGALLSS